ncbi:Gpi16 subunit GPI transamidase component, partial [Fomitopsis schrenkii]
TLLVDLQSDIKAAFVEGYKADLYFRDKWTKAVEGGAQPFAGQCFLAGADQLLYMRINDEMPKLCVPKSQVPFVLAQVHDSPWDSAHEG